jgi:hypothetical protein
MNPLNKYQGDQMNALNTVSRKLRVISRAAALAVGIAASLHVASAAAGSGQVLDEETKKPLAGVFMYALWGAGVWNPAIAKSKCYAHAITQTDENGKFRLRDFSWNFEPWLEGRTRGVGYYLAGYELVRNGDTDPPIVYMRRYTGAALKRMQYIQNNGGEDCLANHERKVLLPLYKAMYDEAKMIAVTPEEKILASEFKNKVDRLELGEQEFHRRRSIMEIK